MLSVDASGGSLRRVCAARLRRIGERDGPGGVKRVFRIAFAAAVEEVPIRFYDAIGGRAGNGVDVLARRRGEFERIRSDRLGEFNAEEGPVVGAIVPMK